MWVYVYACERVCVCLFVCLCAAVRIREHVHTDVTCTHFPHTNTYSWSVMPQELYNWLVFPQCSVSQCSQYYNNYVCGMLVTSLSSAGYI